MIPILFKTFTDEIQSKLDKVLSLVTEDNLELEKPSKSLIQKELNLCTDNSKSFKVKTIDMFIRSKLPFICQTPQRTKAIKTKSDFYSTVPSDHTQGICHNKYFRLEIIAKSCSTIKISKIIIDANQTLADIGKLFECSYASIEQFSKVDKGSILPKEKEISFFESEDEEDKTFLSVESNILLSKFVGRIVEENKSVGFYSNCKMSSECFHHYRIKKHMWKWENIDEVKVYVIESEKGHEFLKCDVCGVNFTNRQIIGDIELKKRKFNICYHENCNKIISDINYK